MKSSLERFASSKEFSTEGASLQRNKPTLKSQNSPQVFTGGARVSETSSGIVQKEITPQNLHWQKERILQGLSTFAWQQALQILFQCEAVFQLLNNQDSLFSWAVILDLIAFISE